MDATKTNHTQSLSTPIGDYIDVAWLTDKQLAFLYTPIQDPNLWEYQIIVHTLDTEEWRVVKVSKPAECLSAWSLRLNRLPNDNLGFIFECSIEYEHTIRSKRTLYMWDRSTGVLQVLQHYPESFFATLYTFAPDMSELIQEEQGGGVEDKLYRVRQDGAIEQLFVNFQRVRSSSWSPDGRTIAFVGTEADLKARSNPFTALVGIGDLLFYPWDLYLMDADGNNTRIILSDIKLADIVKWSPQGRWLAFRGQYEGKDGIWVLDTNTLKLTRVWPSLDIYDWSPDGQKMVIIERTEQNGVEHTRPVVIDVPINQ